MFTLFTVILSKKSSIPIALLTYRKYSIYWIAFYCIAAIEPISKIEQPPPKSRACNCIYNYRIFDLYQKPIVTLAILTDNNPQWRPQSYERNSLYNQLSFQFFSIKLLDYKGQEERLEEDSNPFALVVWAHLEALKTKKQHEKRFHAKTKLTRALYRRGFKKDDIIDLFYFIDWILTLPDPLELQYTEIIEQLEEEKHMRYISSVERVGERKGLERGPKKAVKKLL